MSAGIRWRASLVWIAVVVGVVAASATRNSPLADEQANHQIGKADKPPTVLFIRIRLARPRCRSPIRTPGRRVPRFAADVESAVPPYRQA